ncbi:metallophosphoesterase [uncultured Chitinophaga sp.]|uniref:metallophosphoesterase n=1 Tax=uncultured Chitinophaga sp. TaxID=339340 RepID=UPI0025F00EF0|nr:metallophosphoesterase [uncultured Chitinophaga sp.]
MKQVVFILFVTLFLHQQSQAQGRYTAPALSDSTSWTMIMLPDPQTYVKYARNQPLFELMTAWISENIEKLNIKLVVCTGDLVEQNELINPDGAASNQPSKAQWAAVSGAFNRLNNRVPYVTAAGNHDYGYVKAENRMSNFNTWFPVDKNPLNQQALREVTTNEGGIPTLENAAFEIKSAKGRKFLVLNLEFAPRDTVLAWAKRVVDMEKYKQHTVIMLTHSYLSAANEHIVKEGYGVKDANYGKAIFDKLVKPSRNIQMVLSGHIGAPDDEKAHMGFRTDVNAGGNKVQQMAFNAQALGGGWYGNGGDGWLRILEFMPDDKTVKVRTFSPLFAISPKTQHLAWRTQPQDQFSFILE